MESDTGMMLIPVTGKHQQVLATFSWNLFIEVLGVKIL